VQELLAVPPAVAVDPVVQVVVIVQQLIKAEPAAPTEVVGAKEDGSVTEITLLAVELVPVVQ
jgi:hypothetical protein